MKKQNFILDLTKIEGNLEKIYDAKKLGIFCYEEKVILVDLEARKAKILKFEEEIRRQKSRAIWLSQGDNNTTFFTNMLTIGEILIPYGI